MKEIQEMEMQVKGVEEYGADAVELTMQSSLLSSTICIAVGFL
jgi:hypothetical protein